MGRRALPKLKPEVDFGALYREAGDLPPTFDAVAWFGRPAPLHVEVGSGKGLFLVTEAGHRPADNFLGIEIARKYAQFAAYRCAQNHRSNVRVICGDAVKLLSHWLPDQTADSVHVYFPDPWWKARHRKRRVLQETLVRAVQRILRPDGKLHFWTDVEEYFQAGIETVRTHTNLQGPFPVDVPENDDGSFRTHFERRTRLHGQPVYRAEFLKPTVSALPTDQVTPIQPGNSVDELKPSGQGRSA